MSLPGVSVTFDAFKIRVNIRRKNPFGVSEGSWGCCFPGSSF